MAYDFNGTNSGASIPDISSVGDFSISFIGRYDATATAKSVFAFDNFPTSPRQACIVKTASSTQLRFEARIGGTGTTSDFTNTYTNEQIYTIRRSGTSAILYIDGTQVASITVGSGTFTMPNIRFGCHFFSGSNQEFADANIAEFGLWLGDIGTDGVAQLAARMSPKLVRPDILERYISFVRTPIDEVGGVTVSNIGSPAVAAHPRVYLPGEVIVGVPTAAGGGGAIKELAGSVAVATAFSGAASLVHGLSGSLAAQATFSGTLSARLAIQGAVQAQTVFAGNLTIIAGAQPGIKELAGSIAAQTAFAGVLSQRLALAGTISAQTAFTGTLQGNVNPVELAGSIAVQMTLGTLTLESESASWGAAGAGSEIWTTATLGGEAWSNGTAGAEVWTRQ